MVAAVRDDQVGLLVDGEAGGVVELAGEAAGGAEELDRVLLRVEHVDAVQAQVHDVEPPVRVVQEATLGPGGEAEHNMRSKWCKKY